jgi:hypothetical protein
MYHISVIKTNQQVLPTEITVPCSEMDIKYNKKCILWAGYGTFEPLIWWNISQILEFEVLMKHKYLFNPLKTS